MTKVELMAICFLLASSSAQACDTWITCDVKSVTATNSALFALPHVGDQSQRFITRDQEWSSIVFSTESSASATGTIESITFATPLVRITGPTDNVVVYLATSPTLTATATFNCDLPVNQDDVDAAKGTIQLMKGDDHAEIQMDCEQQ